VILSEQNKISTFVNKFKTYLVTLRVIKQSKTKTKIKSRAGVPKNSAIR
jgi:hypothetical protein